MSYTLHCSVLGHARETTFAAADDLNAAMFASLTFIAWRNEFGDVAEPKLWQGWRLVAIGGGR